MALERVGLTGEGPSETKLTCGGEAGGAGWGGSCKNCLAVFNASPPSSVFAASLDGVSLRANCYLLLFGRGGGKFQEGRASDGRLGEGGRGGGGCN